MKLQCLKCLTVLETQDNVNTYQCGCSNKLSLTGDNSHSYFTDKYRNRFVSYFDNATGEWSRWKGENE